MCLPVVKAKLQNFRKSADAYNVATEELPNQLNAVKELAREHSKWLLRYTNIHVPKHEELIPIIVATKAYKTKEVKGKKSK